MNTTWTADAVDFVRQQAGVLTDAALAEALTKKFGRVVSKAAARQKRQSLRLKKKCGRGVCELDLYRFPAVGLIINGTH